MTGEHLKVEALERDRDGAMEEKRQIRILIPPFMLLFGFLTGLAVGFYGPVREFLTAVAQIPTIPAIIGVVAAGGIIIIALGFIISSISIVFLRGILGVDYEVDLPEDVLEGIEEAIGIRQNENSRSLYPGALYDHWVLEKKAPGVHRWLGRRWNAFNVSFNSCTAIFFHGLLGLLNSFFLCLVRGNGTGLCF